MWIFLDYSVCPFCFQMYPVCERYKVILEPACNRCVKVQYAANNFLQKSCLLASNMLLALFLPFSESGNFHGLVKNLIVLYLQVFKTYLQIYYSYMLKNILFNSFDILRKIIFFSSSQPRRSLCFVKKVYLSSNRSFWYYKL